MGGSSSSQQQTSQTQSATPYWQAQQPLNSILSNIGGISTQPTGAENSALNNLMALGQQGNPFAGGITNVANQLLTGGPDRTGIGLAGYNQFQDQMGATARGDYMDPNKNPFWGAATSGVFDKAKEALDKSYAVSGTSPTASGSYGMRLGETVTDALAPYFMQQYNQERTNQLGAQNALYGASNTTSGLLSNLDAQRAGIQQAGIGAAQEATGAQNWGDMQVLAAEAQRRGIPLETMAQQMGIVLPAAQAFGTTTSTGTQTGTATKPFSESFKDYMSIGNLWSKK